MGWLGRKKKKEDNPSAQDNPYAQQLGKDPYTHDQQAKTSVHGTVNSAPFSTPPPPYAGSPKTNGGYSSDKPGASGGYGYGSNASGYGYGQTSPAFPSPGSGRTGSLGDRNTRDEFGGGARERAYGSFNGPPSYGPSSNNQPSYGAPNNTNNRSMHGSFNGPPSYGSSNKEDPSYPSVDNENDEDQALQDIKQAAREARFETLESAKRTMNVVDQTLVLVGQTQERVGKQGSMIDNALKNTIRAELRVADAKKRTAELKSANGMFGIYRPAETAEQSDKAVEENYRKIQQLDAETQHTRNTLKNNFNAERRLPPQPTANDRYKLEDDDSEDEAMEDQINDTVNGISNGVTQLNYMAKHIGAELDRQTNVIQRTTEQAGNLQVSVEKRRRELDQIR